MMGTMDRAHLTELNGTWKVERRSKGVGAITTSKEATSSSRISASTDIGPPFYRSPPLSIVLFLLILEISIRINLQLSWRRDCDGE